MTFRCYSDIKEKICWTLHPCKNVGKNITWEQWHVKIPLYIFVSDYEKLLWEHVTKIYPLKEPINGEIIEAFDPCFDNWIGKDDWNKIIKVIKDKLIKVNNHLPRLEKEFYKNFLEWIERELEWADIIVIDSNL